MLNLSLGAPGAIELGTSDPTSGVPDSSLKTATEGPDGALAPGAFGAFFARAMNTPEGRALTTDDGKVLPVADLQTQFLGNETRLVMAADGEAPADEALYAFAIQQGMDPATVAAVLWPGLPVPAEAQRLAEALLGSSGGQRVPVGVAGLLGGSGLAGNNAAFAGASQTAAEGGGLLGAGLTAGPGSASVGSEGAAVAGSQSSFTAMAMLASGLAGVDAPTAAAKRFGAQQGLASSLATAGQQVGEADGGIPSAAALSDLVASPGRTGASTTSAPVLPSSGGELQFGKATTPAGAASLLNAGSAASMVTSMGLAGSGQGATPQVSVSVQTVAGAASATQPGLATSAAPGLLGMPSASQVLGGAGRSRGSGADANASWSAVMNTGVPLVGAPVTQAAEGRSSGAISGLSAAPGWWAQQLGGVSSSAMVNAVSYARMPVATDVIETDEALGEPESATFEATLQGAADGAEPVGHSQGAASHRASHPADVLTLHRDEAPADQTGDADGNGRQAMAQRLAEGLAQRISAQLAQNNWKLQVELRPAHLGQVTVELAMQGGQLEARFDASQAASRAMIQEGFDRLRQDLERSGMNVAYLGMQGGGGSSGGGKPTPRSRPGEVTETVEAASAPEVRGPGRGNRLGLEGLDVMV